MGAIPTIGPYLIPSALPALRARFPKLNIYLREEMTENLIEGVVSGRLDLALIALPFDVGALEISPLFEDGYQLAMPKLWSEAQPTSAREELEGGTLMLLEKGTVFSVTLLRLFLIGTYGRTRALPRPV